jgi:hypothetical protein
MSTATEIVRIAAGVPLSLRPEAGLKQSLATEVSP